MSSVRNMMGDGATWGGAVEEYSDPYLDESGAVILRSSRRLLIAPGALKKRDAMVRRRREREEWKLQRKQLEAIRDLKGLSVGHEMSTDSLELSPRSKVKGLSEKFKQLDAARDGTVPCDGFVSVMRHYDLDLGDDATLSLLQRYNREGRVDYHGFMHNIKNILFPRTAPTNSPCPGGDMRGTGDVDLSEIHEEAPNVEWMRGANQAVAGGVAGRGGGAGGRRQRDSPSVRSRNEIDEADDLLLAKVRTKVARLWSRLRKEVPSFDECLNHHANSSGRKSKHSLGDDLEAQLDQRRILQVFQRALSPEEISCLTDAYQSWCVSRHVRVSCEGDADPTAVSSKTWSEFLRLFILSDSRGGEVSGVGGYQSSLRAIKAVVIEGRRQARREHRAQDLENRQEGRREVERGLVCTERQEDMVEHPPQLSRSQSRMSSLDSNLGNILAGAGGYGSVNHGYQQNRRHHVPAGGAKDHSSSRSSSRNDLPLLGLLPSVSQSSLNPSSSWRSKLIHTAPAKQGPLRGRCRSPQAR